LSKIKTNNSPFSIFVEIVTLPTGEKQITITIALNDQKTVTRHNSSALSIILHIH